MQCLGIKELCIQVGFHPFGFKAAFYCLFYQLYLGGFQQSQDSIILKRIKNLEEAKDIEKFEKAFKSMWKTAKARGIKKRDVEKEIEAYRKDKNV